MDTKNVPPIVHPNEQGAPACDASAKEIKEN
jgi:hypothetical protein